MELLFLHPNYPGQFRRIAPALARLPGMRVIGAGDAAWMRPEETFPGLAQVIRYTTSGTASTAHRWARPFDGAVRRGQEVIEGLAAFKREGLEPDVVFVHPGWGDGLFLRDFFPGCRVVSLFEYYYRPRGADVGFDPEFPSQLDDVFRLRALNATQLLALDNCDAAICPTHWQRTLFPETWRSRMQVVHEGIDTVAIAPDPKAGVRLADGRILRRGDEVLTFVSRNLEPYRGFHVFMRALPAILRARPRCEVLVVGGDGVSYGVPCDGETYREKLVREVGAGLDLSRVHFMGTLPHADYVRVLQVSRLHVYLTYPFILSWSCLEAMSAGCVVLASDTPPVQEVIGDGREGLLFPFHSPDALAERAIEVLEAPRKFQDVAAQARASVVRQFDFATVSLPAFQRLLTDPTP